ncbi:WD40/YVTN repeat-like-containing domain superfamily [Sesbania bispinosa]|nr:WD40/YVTN repeat-like-containing domain superfamily [Sesbania bispinosa]
MDMKLLSDVYIVKEEITSFAVIPHSLYMYVGVSNGNISVLKLDQEPWHVVRMKYTIPLSASYGNSTQVSDDTVVTHILPQPAAESKRVLIIFRNGQIILWDIRESRSIFRAGGNMSQSMYNETKKVSSACWVCPFGSKVVVGYNNGELFIWSIPPLNRGNGSTSDYSSQNTPIFKLNLGYKSDKTSIGSLKWIYAEGKASRLYVMGASDYAPSNSLQVVLLNEHIESRTIKLGLHLSEGCIDMEIITSSEQSKHKQCSLLLLGKSGHVYLYDDSLIERYLLQCQSKSTPSLPKEVIVKLPLADSSITTAKFISNNPNVFNSQDESENDFSLSGVPLTELYFDSNSPLLVSGDQSGMVRIFRFKPEPYASNSFMSLAGGTKKGADHVIRSVKLVKTIGAVICMNIDHNSRHLAVGSDQGNFITCSLHGFEKNILAVGTKDSSVLALDSETGNTLSTGAIQPKKPSKALFMQVLDGQGEQITRSITKDGLDFREGNHIEDATTKQLYILMCSEKALYVYSFEHAIEGIKKVLYKKKFQSSSCCWASTFYSPSDIGLILLFTNGKAQLRSLPELSLRVETLIKGFSYSPPKLKSISDSQICCSSRGDIVLVNGDQEIFVVSLLVQRNIFRLLDSISCIYKKERMLSQEELVPGTVIHKEKKKGIFSSVVKDFTSSKEKHIPLVEKEDPEESIQELSAMFSNANFPLDANDDDNSIVDENKLELNIDDIDIEDHGEKRKEQSILGALNKKNLAGKFQVLKGRLKEMKGNNQKASDKGEQQLYPKKGEQQNEKADALDQIKKKYGFSSSSGTSVAKLAESKLQDNIRKLQGINLRTTEMQDTAKSFSSLAKQVLRTAEHDRQN